MVPESCEKCGHNRFREQEREDGSVFICKACGHEHKAAKPKKSKDKQ